MSGIVVAAVIGTAKLYGLWVIYEHIYPQSLNKLVLFC